MGKKRRMVLIAGLVMGMTAGSMAAVALTGCNHKIETVIEDVTGVYYGKAGDKDCEIELDGSSEGTFSFWLNGGTLKQGEFTYNGTDLNLTFSDDSEIKANLVKSEDDKFVLSIDYDGTSFVLGKTVRYQVNFKDGNSVLQTTNVVNGKTVAIPQTPTKKDCAFLGWYEDSALTKKFDFANKTVTGATDVYARFVEVDASKTVFDVTFSAGEGVTAPASVKTINGKIYDLPEVTKSGATFAGWWVSDYEDASKLTYKYEGQELNQNTTLFAVWESNAPLVSITPTGAKWTAKGTNNSYDVTVTLPDGTEDKLGSQSTTTLTYDFSTSGDYIISVTLRGQTTKVYFNNKGLARVSAFTVEGNVLKFAGVAGAERYGLKIDCGNSSHNHEKEIDLGNNTEYDFSSCGMKAEGISFVVTAYADGSVSSKSNPYVLERHLEAVKNIAVDATDTLKWDAVDNAVSYTVNIKSGEKTQEYRISNSEVDKGIFLGEYAGELEISVLPVAFGYNSPAATELTLNKTRLSIPKNIKNNDYVVSWDPVSGATGYIIKIGDGDPFEVSGTEYTLTDAQFTDGVATVYVCAKGAATENNSVFGTPCVINKGFMSPSYAKGKVSWGATFGAAYYEVKVNEGEPFRVEGLSTPVTLTQKGENVIYVRFSDGEKLSDWFKVSVTAYQVTVEVNANLTQVYYKAAGDDFDLSDAEKQGYTFNGWYIKGGAKFEDAVYGASDITLEAGYVANKYTITLVYDSNAGDKADAKETVELTYNENFELPVPASSDSTKTFGGWNFEKTGTGLQFTLPDGKSTQAWNIANDTNLYVSWLDVFTFTALPDGGYSVSKGAGINYVDNIKIPSSVDGVPVKQLGSGAFSDCRNLKRVEIPNSIELVARSDSSAGGVGSAFQGCTALDEVNVYAVDGFNADAALYSSVDGVLLYDNPRTGEKEISYFPVARTGVYTVPEGVTVLSVGVLSSTSLTEVRIPATVKEIAGRAFSYSKSLEKVTFLPETGADGEVERSLSIAENAFSGCENLSDVTLPSYLTELNKEAFYNCKMLKNINVDAGNLFSSDDGVVIKQEEGGVKTVYLCPRARDTEYTISDPAISKIDEAAFKGCSLETFYVPEWLTEIGKEAFRGCSNLKTLTFSEKNTEGSLKICEAAFYSTGLTALSLPAHLETLETHAFGNTSGLHKITVNCTKTEISYAASAFSAEGSGSYCYVNELEIGKDVPEIDISSVFGSKTLQKVTVHPENQNYEEQDGVLFNKGKTEIKYYPFGKEGDYVIPDTVTKIGANIFEARDNITVITISKNIKEIGERAFYNCTNLETVTFADATVETDGEAFTTLIIGKEAFASCDKFVELSLPTRLRTIGDKAFAVGGTYTQKKVETLTVPEGVTTIGHSAFHGWAPINLSLPSTLESIGMFYKDEVDKSSLYNPYNTTDWYYDVDKKMPASQYNTDMFVSRPDRGSAIRKYIFPATLQSVTVAEGNKNYCVVDGMFCIKDKENDVPTDVLFTPMSNAGVEGVLTIPSTITTIRDFAFDGNAGVTKIEFQGGSGELSLTFGAGVFSGMSKLETLQLPDGLKEIAGGMFQGCAGLKGIIIPNTVTKIGVNAFKGCVDLAKVEFKPGGTEDLVFEAGNIENKNTASGRPSYTHVNDTVFSGCTSLKEIELPERMKTIGVYAFGLLTNLERVKIPASVTKIGQYAFAGCSSLAEIEFAPGSQLKEICSKAFSYFDIRSGETYVESHYLDKLTELTLPEGLVTLGSKDTDYKTSAYQTLGKVFEGCRALGTLNLPVSLETIEEKTFYSESSSTALTSLQNVNFPEGSKLKKIGAYGFACASNAKSSMTEIDLSNCTLLTEIGDYAFAYNNFTTFEVPVSVTKLGASAFNGCADMTGVSFEKDVNGKSAVTSIGDSCFASSGLTSFEFPVTSGSSLAIGKTIFNNCKNLSVVTLSDSVTSISGVLNGCFSVRQLIIPESNTSMKADKYNPMILNIDGTSIQLAFGAIAMDSEGTYRIPEGIVTIEDAAFKNQKGIKKIILPKTLQSIGANAFENCMSLEEIGFASEADSSDANLTTVCGNAFKYCVSLKKVDLGSKINSIGSNAFYSCKNLATVTLREGLKYLGANAFTFSGLTAVTLPSTLEYKSAKDTSLQDKVSVFSGAEAFRNCDKLTSVTIKSTWLGSAMFQSAGLTSVTIPSTVKTIYGTGLFTECTSLTTATVNLTVAANASISTATSKMFYKCTALTTVTIGDNVKMFGTSMFEGCSSLTSAGIKMGAVETFGTTVFKSCTSLTQFDLSSVTKFGGGSTFSGCTSLTKVVLNDGVTSIGGSIFENCEKLVTVQCYDAKSKTTLGAEKEVNLPSALTTLGGNTFSGCKSVTKITVPASVTKVANTDFKNCASLKELYLYAKITSLANSLFACSSSNDLSKLEKIVINDAITDFGYSIWEGCSSLKTIQCYDSTSKTTLGAENEVTLPSGLLFMNNKVLRNTAVEVINLPSTIKYVCTQAEAKKIFNTTKTPSKTTTPGVAYETNLRDLPNLKAVKVSNDFVYLTDSPFTGSANLANFGVYSKKDENETYSMAKLTHIGANAFTGTNLSGVIDVSLATELGSGAFSGTAITGVTLSESLTEIPANLFENCASLTTITIPATVTTIGAAAFKGSAVADVTLPENLTAIPASMFENCASLTTITLPATVTSIGAAAFKGSAITDITLPATLTAIPASMFENCASLTAITIPATVTSIGDNAFKATGISSVELPAGLLSIGGGAFQDCEQLAEIALPEGLQTIGFQCFFGCGFTTITLPASLTSLGGNAFYGVDVSVASGEGATYLMNSGAVVDNTGKLIYLPVDFTSEECLVLPEGITGIAGYVFNGKGGAIPAIKLPSTLTSLDENAFWNYSGAIDLSAATNYTEVGAKAFRTYKGSSLTLPEWITAIGTKSFENCTAKLDLSACAITTIPVDGFYNFYGAELKLPATIATSNDAFDGCTASVDLSASALTAIPKSGFYNFQGAELKLPATITSIGANAFESCAASVDLSACTGLTEIPTYCFYKSTATDIKLPNSLTTLGNYAFRDCANITSMVIPEGVNITNKPYKPFFDCTSLASITFPSTWTNITGNGSSFMLIENCPIIEIEFPEGVTEISYCFSKCAQLTKIVLPSTVEKISTLFSNCTEISELQFAEGMTTLPSLSGLTGITSIVIPSTVTTLPASAFKGTGITSITLPEGLTAIPASTFEGCAALTSVTIPSTVTSIGKTAFKGSGITSITLPEGLTDIPANAFENCEALTSVTIPATVTSIGASAFKNTGITSITLPEGITTIPASMVADCAALVSVTIPATVTSIGASAFLNCSALEEIELSEGLTTINTDAFTGCSSLKKIVIPTTVTSLNKAFAHWTEEQEIVFNVNAYDGTTYSLSYSTWNSDVTCKAKASVVCLNPVYVTTDEPEE